MAYIGKEPAVGNFQVCDAISVVNGQAAYTMQVSSTNVVPESANHMLVSLNGILQKPNSSFTVSGSTITFASNLATGDVIDFIMLLGNVLDIGTPSDSTVTNAKTNFVTTSSAAGLQIKGDSTTAGALQLNCEQNSHGIKLQSPPHSANQSYTLKFPSGNVTAGKFLKVDSVSGSGTTGVGTMTFADGGGRFTLINTTTIGGGSTYVDLDDVFTDTYKNYLLVATGIDINTDGQDLHIQVKNSSGLINGASDYEYSYLQRHTNSNTTETAYDVGQDYILTNHNGIGNQAVENANLLIEFNNVRSTSHYKLINCKNTAFGQSTNGMMTFSVGTVETTTALTGIRIKTSSGNLDAGTLKLYGAD